MQFSVLKLQRRRARGHSMRVTHPGEVIKMWRKERKISIPTLAQMSKVDPGTISRFERGGNYKQRTFEETCKALGKTVVDAYAVLCGSTAKPAPVAASGCIHGIEYHNKLLRMLDEILHADEAWASGISVNVESLHASALGYVPGPPGKRKYSPDDPPSVGDIVELPDGRERIIGSRAKRRKN